MDKTLANGKNMAMLAAIGVLIGIISVASPGVVFDLIFVAVSAMAIFYFSDPAEKDFFVKLFLWGLLARTILLLLVQTVLIHSNTWFCLDIFGGRATYLFNDDGYYTLRSWGLTQNIGGLQQSHAVVEKIYEPYGYTFYLYLMSLFHYLFGFSPISVTLMNCLFGVFTGIIYYFIAKDMSDLVSARIAAVAIVFFPSLMIWSIVNLKDSLFMFLMGIVLLSFVRLIRKGRVWYWALLAAALCLQALVRPKLIMFEGGIAIWACVFYLYVRGKLKVGYILLAVVCAVLAWQTISINLAICKNTLVNYNKGIIGTGGLVYKIYSDWVYVNDASPASISNLEMVKAVLKGWFHFFLEPLPWRMRSPLSVSAFPQMVICYAMLPFGIGGVFVQLRRNGKMTLALLVFFIFTGTIFVMTGGNIGTDFRIRDMLTPLIIVFTAIGLRTFFFRKKRNEQS